MKLPGHQSLTPSVAMAMSFRFGNGMKYIEDIYFFEVNTKYTSSNVLKISAFSWVRSMSEIHMFNTWDEIFLVFTEKKK